MGKLTCCCRTSVGLLPGQGAEREPEPLQALPAAPAAPSRRFGCPLSGLGWCCSAASGPCSHIISEPGSLASLTEAVTIKLEYFAGPSISSCICASITSVPTVGLTLRPKHLHLPQGSGFTPFRGSLGPDFHPRPPQQVEGSCWTKF